MWDEILELVGPFMLLFNSPNKILSNISDFLIFDEQNGDFDF